MKLVLNKTKSKLHFVRKAVVVKGESSSQISLQVLDFLDVF